MLVNVVKASYRHHYAMRRPHLPRLKSAIVACMQLKQLLMLQTAAEGQCQIEVGVSQYLYTCSGSFLEDSGKISACEGGVWPHLQQGSTMASCS